MNKLIDKYYPQGWRWLGTLTSIAFLATLAGYAIVPFGFSDLPAKMVLSAFVLLLFLSGGVIAFARTYYKLSIACAVLALVWVIGQIMYWSPYWAA